MPCCVLHTSHGLKVTGSRFSWIAALETVGKDRRAAGRDGRPPTPGSCPRFATSRADDLASYDLVRAQLEGRPPLQPLALAADNPARVRSRMISPSGLGQRSKRVEQQPPAGCGRVHRRRSDRNPRPRSSSAVTVSTDGAGSGRAGPSATPQGVPRPQALQKRIQLRTPVQHPGRRGRRTPHSSPLRSARRPAGRRSAPPSTPAPSPAAPPTPARRSGKVRQDWLRNADCVHRLRYTHIPSPPAVLLQPYAWVKNGRLWGQTRVAALPECAAQHSPFPSLQKRGKCHALW